MQTIRSLLPFDGAPSVAERLAIWHTEPQATFRPHGLMLWNLPDESAAVELVQIGLTPQLVAAVGPIPARWFTFAHSYEQVWAAHQRGIDPPGWGDWMIIAIGLQVQVRLSSKRDVTAEEWGRVQLLMWGESIR